MHHEKTSFRGEDSTRIEPIKLENHFDVHFPRNWRGSIVSEDRRFHLLKGKPMYLSRFDEVMSFHDPGLAPVRTGKKWYHIKPDGSRAYPQSYDRVWGYYFGLAAVVSKHYAYHINSKGEPGYESRFCWTGNFQDGYCAVKYSSGRFGHILSDGNPLYRQTYKYVGDFKESAAVVQLNNGMHVHIDPEGSLVNGKQFIDLGTFHKGLAPAKDRLGWYHINTEGKAQYSRRFSSVEPFYNGQARVQTGKGDILLIDESGEILGAVREEIKTSMQYVSDMMVSYWKSRLIHSAVELGLFDGLPSSTKKLAQLVSLPMNNCRRVMRALWELDLVDFREGEWRATSTGSLLRDDSNYNMKAIDWNWSVLGIEPWLRLTIALRKEENDMDSRATPFFDSLSKTPDSLRRYHEAMRIYSDHDYEELPNLLDNKKMNEIADAGCGHSSALFNLLRKNTELKGFLFDLPNVILEVKVPRALQDRVKKIGGDIFKKWPFSADVVLMTRVLHDWDDIRARQILINAKRAIREKGRIYIVELVLNDENPYGSLADINLLITCGGHERTDIEWKRLFDSVGLKILSMSEMQRYGMLMEIGVK